MKCVQLQTLIIYLLLFAFAGYNLLISVNTPEYATGMGSEKFYYYVKVRKEELVF